MNYEPNSTKIYHIMIILSLLIFTLSACGSGGENDNSVVTTIETTSVTTTTTDTSGAIVDYSPEEDKLITEAASSSELYVEQTFNFDSFKVLHVDISAKDIADEPIRESLVSISGIADSISELADPLINEKALITNVFTDNNGQINIKLEVSNSINNLLLEIKALGIENKVIFKIDESAIVMHNF